MARKTWSQQENREDQRGKLNIFTNFWEEAVREPSEKSTDLVKFKPCCFLVGHLEAHLWNP